MKKRSLYPQNNEEYEIKLTKLTITEKCFIIFTIIIFIILIMFTIGETSWYNIQL